MYMYMYIHHCTCESLPDLHADLGQQSQGRSKMSGDHLTLPSVTEAEPTALTSSVAGSPAANIETSPLIKATPSPKGTPMRTAFTGTQNFTPSTRISALNMVGDLLRKVGVSFFCISAHFWSFFLYLQFWDS